MKTLLTLAAMLCVGGQSQAAMRGMVQTQSPTTSTKGFATTITVGPSLNIPGAGGALPGFAFTAATNVAHDVPLYVGADSGFYFTGAPTFHGQVPVLATMYFEFVSTSNPRVRPLLGVSAGPTFGVGEGQQAAQFAMFAKPGINIQLADGIDLNIESRLGVVGSTFTYLPQVAASFAM